MRLSYVGALGAILTNVNANAQVPNAEGSLLIHTNDLPRIELNSVNATGSVNNQRISISITKKVESSIPIFQVSASIGDLKLGKFAVALDKLPKLDVESAQYYGRTSGKRMIKIEFRFSDARNCFVNDDGRSRFTAMFEPGKAPQGYVISYEGCEPTVTSL